MNLISRPPTLFLFHPNGIPNGIPTHCFGLWSSIISLSRMESSDGLLPHSLSLSPLSIYPRQPRQYIKKKPVPRTKRGVVDSVSCLWCTGAPGPESHRHPHTHTCSRRFLFFLFLLFLTRDPKVFVCFFPPFCLLACGWMDGWHLLFVSENSTAQMFYHTTKRKKKQKNGPYLKVEINICSYHYHHNARHNNNNTVTRNERKKTNLQTCRIFKQDKTNIGGDKNKQKK